MKDNITVGYMHVILQPNTLVADYSRTRHPRERARERKSMYLRGSKFEFVYLSLS